MYKHAPVQVSGLCKHLITGGLGLLAGFGSELYNMVDAHSYCKGARSHVLALVRLSLSFTWHGTDSIP